VANDTFIDEIFVRDLQTHTTERVSVTDSSGEDRDTSDLLIGGMGAHDQCIGDLGDSFAASCEGVHRFVLD
jgi:hypothetical protein